MPYLFGLHPIRTLLEVEPQRVRRLYLQAGPAPRLAALQQVAERRGIEVNRLGRAGLERRVGAAVHQGAVAEVLSFTYASLESMLAASGAGPPLIVVLDGVQDPHNVGALARSALALGAHGLIVAKDRACEVTAGVHKASAGATALLPIARVTNLRRALDDLRGRGLWLVGTTPTASRPLESADLTLPTALVLGAEGQGLRRLVAAGCDLTVKIPMVSAAASLNAAVAGAICLYEASRQRGKSPRGP